MLPVPEGAAEPEAVPEVVDKVTNFIKDQQDRKEKTADLAD